MEAEAELQYQLHSCEERKVTGGGGAGTDERPAKHL